MKHKRIYLTLCIFLLLALTGCFRQAADSTAAPEASEETGSFTLTFITIGKGDSFLLSPSDGTHYLIDTGKKKDYPQIDRLLRTKGIDRLDGIFLSHGHKDHAGGLESLLSSFPVVNRGCLAFSTSGIPTPLSFTTISTTLSSKSRKRMVTFPMVSG